MENEVRFSVYDSRGKFMGYKADSFWTLSEKYIKSHSVESSEIDSVIFDNLLYILNGKGSNDEYPREFAKRADLDERGSLYVVTENWNGDVLSGVSLFIGRDEKYHILKKSSSGLL